MTTLFTEEPTADEKPSGPNRFMVMAIAFGVTTGSLLLAVILGAFGYEIRSISMHEGRMRNMLAKQPTLSQALEAFKNEGTILLAAADDPQELAPIATGLGGQKRPEILQKSASWPVVRAFRAGDMVYFVYFDQEQVMKGFTCVRHR